ncbi:hypothetical protein LTR84_009853 [Exophiala bonariae]|uniref:NmrA-like domain-containing protein n=1 Tax=Exophiala bonariae TaxID=1690606 RepID=A0AAV9NN38_9EURO|nr:hypothetical protein LTR84_009853 [Exophiala bonariae]
MERVYRRPVIAIAGATGDLGSHLVKAFLAADVISQLSGLILLSRRHTPLTETWKAKGAQVRIVDEAGDIGELVDALEGVDILINAISSAGARLRDNMIRALPKTKTTLYFPSEFGVDYTTHNFGIPEWDDKKEHFELMAKTLMGSRVQFCRLFIGLFLHKGIGPWFGFHTSKDVYQVYGSLDQSVSYTDLGDVARVIQILTDEALAGHMVPTSLRIAGSHSSIRETAKAMEEAGAGTIELRSADLDRFKIKALARPYAQRDAVVFLRFLMADGRIDLRPEHEGGMGNDNELVNPGQKHFRWKTIDDLARDTRGRPNADA